MAPQLAGLRLSPAINKQSRQLQAERDCRAGLRPGIYENGKK